MVHYLLIVSCFSLIVLLLCSLCPVPFPLFLSYSFPCPLSLPIRSLFLRWAGQWEKRKGGRMHGMAEINAIIYGYKHVLRWIAHKICGKRNSIRNGAFMGFLRSLTWQNDVVICCPAWFWRVYIQSQDISQPHPHHHVGRDKLLRFIEGAARLRGSAKAIDVWRLETKVEVPPVAPLAATR